MLVQMPIFIEFTVTSFADLYKHLWWLMSIIIGHIYKPLVLKRLVLN